MDITVCIWCNYNRTWRVYTECSLERRGRERNGEINGVTRQIGMDEMNKCIGCVLHITCIRVLHVVGRVWEQRRRGHVGLGANSRAARRLERSNARHDSPEYTAIYCIREYPRSEHEATDGYCPPLLLTPYSRWRVVFFYSRFSVGPVRCGVPFIWIMYRKHAYSVLLQSYCCSECSLLFALIYQALYSLTPIRFLVYFELPLTSVNSINLRIHRLSGKMLVMLLLLMQPTSYSGRLTFFHPKDKKWYFPILPIPCKPHWLSWAETFISLIWISHRLHN